MEDYYKLLGLDPDASQEAIKIAYRHLAREHHPDRNIDSSNSDQRAGSEHMLHLNEAYAILSHAKQRREYDEKIRLVLSLENSKSSETKPKFAEPVGKPKPAARATPPRDDVDITLAHELSKQLRANLVKHHKRISWEERNLDGFDWGLEGSSGMSHYCVAGRGFGILDIVGARKFTNYSEVVVARLHRSIRKSHFLFILPFQRLTEWDSVKAEFNRFLSNESYAKLPIDIVLMDARKGQSVCLGTKGAEKRLEDLRKSVFIPS